jgi:hypothetical protein
MRWLDADFVDWGLEAECCLNLGAACVSKCCHWSFPSIYSPLPNTPCLNTHFSSTPTSWTYRHVSYSVILLVLYYLFDFLALAPIIHQSVYFKPHQGQWLSCSNIGACYMCHSPVMSALFLFINYMHIGPYFYSIIVFITSLFS